MYEIRYKKSGKSGLTILPLTEDIDVDDIDGIHGPIATIIAGIYLSGQSGYAQLYQDGKLLKTYLAPGKEETRISFKGTIPGLFADCNELGILLIEQKEGPQEDNYYQVTWCGLCGYDTVTFSFASMDTAFTFYEACLGVTGLDAD